MAYLAKTMPRTLYWWSAGTRPHIALYVNPILLALVRTMEILLELSALLVHGFLGRSLRLIWSTLDR